MNADTVVRSMRRGVIGVVTLVVSSLLVSTPASAGGGYPSDHARDCSSQFGIYSWCIDANRDGRFQQAEAFSGYGFAYRNCTDYVAWKINSLGSGFSNTMNGGRFGNAKNWDDNARNLGWTVSATPRVRAIAVSNAGTYGHVAFVESVNGDGSVNVSEYNSAVKGGYGTRNGVRFDAYVYVSGVTQTPAPPAPPANNVGRYANTIVKWSGDANTSWYVTPDLKRLWIPDGGTYNQLKSRGVAGPHVLDSATLNQLPDLKNQWVASGSTWTGNRTMRRGMTVKSADGRYTFAMQNDGNLVLYGPSGRAVWSSDRVTSSWRAQEFVIFQADGNLVTYGGGRAVWSTSTAGKGATRFEVQNDGNLVVYAGNRALWASGTGGRT